MTNWEEYFAIQDPNQSLLEFYNIIFSVFEKILPIKRYGSNNIRKRIFPIWWDQDTKNIFLRKEKARKQKNNNYNELRKTCKKQIKTNYKTFLHELQNKLRTDSKKEFWNFIKSKSKNPSKLIYRMDDDRILSDPEEISNTFASYFNSVYTSGSNYNILSQDCVIELHTFILTEADVRNGIQSLKNKSEGMDSIHPNVLKNCSDIFSKIFHHIFNKALEHKVFPDLLKFTLVTPVPKKNNTNLITNNRPISCLTVVSKLFEACVFDKLSSFVYNKISPNQHGFIERRSTVSNLAHFHHSVAKSLGDGCSQVDIVYTDIMKAYDRLSHEVLLRKLLDFGFHPNIVAFIGTYLRQREHRVIFQNYISEPYYPTSSVIQGSKLSSLFFAIVIDGIGEIIKNSNYLLYADDFKIFKGIKNDSDHRLLQEDLSAVKIWLDKHGLSFHPDKCEVMSITKKKNPHFYAYHINNTTLNRVLQKKDLGITFQHDLKFDIHITEIISSAMRNLGLSDTRNISMMSLPSQHYTQHLSEVNWSMDLSSGLLLHKTTEKILRKSKPDLSDFFLKK